MNHASLLMEKRILAGAIYQSSYWLEMLSKGEDSPYDDEVLGIALNGAQNARNKIIDLLESQQ